MNIEEKLSTSCSFKRASTHMLNAMNHAAARIVNGVP